MLVANSALQIFILANYIQVGQFHQHLHLQYNILIKLNVPWKKINKELKLYNYDYKKIKIVHDIASIFSGKRRDQYGVRILFPNAKIWFRSNSGYQNAHEIPCARERLEE